MSNCDCAECNEARKLSAAALLTFRGLMGISPLSRHKVRKILTGCVTKGHEESAKGEGDPTINSAYFNIVTGFLDDLEKAWEVVDAKFAEDCPQVAALMKEVESAISADTSKDA